MGAYHGLCVVTDGIVRGFLFGLFGHVDLTDVHLGCIRREVLFVIRQGVGAIGHRIGLAGCFDTLRSVAGGQSEGAQENDKEKASMGVFFTAVPPGGTRNIRQI